MSEILITLPFSMFGNQSVEEVIANIKAFQQSQAEKQQFQQQNEQLRHQLTSVANDLVEIINHDEDVMWKFQALRSLSTSITQVVRELQ